MGSNAFRRKRIAYCRVTLKEIYQMEKQLKTQRLNLDCDCSGFKYGYVIFTVPLGWGLE